MTVVRSADSRRTETPNGVMTTLASPTQGAAASALWRVDMHPGAQGPLHAFEVEQIWTFLEGSARLELGDETFTVTAGDTVVLPAGASRRLTAEPAGGFVAIVSAPADAKVRRVDAPDVEAFVPAWAV